MPQPAGPQRRRGGARRALDAELTVLSAAHLDRSVRTGTGCSHSARSGAHDMRQNTLRVRLLGPVDLQLDDQPLPPLDSARAESLLAYLLLHRDAAQPRQRLAFLLWPGSTEARRRRTCVRSSTTCAARCRTRTG